MIGISSEYKKVTRSSKKPFIHVYRRHYRSWSSNLCLNRKSSLHIILSRCLNSRVGVTSTIVGASISKGWDTFVVSERMEHPCLCHHLHVIPINDSSTGSSKWSLVHLAAGIYSLCGILRSARNCAAAIRLLWELFGAPHPDMLVLYVISPPTRRYCSSFNYMTLPRSNRVLLSSGRHEKKFKLQDFIQKI